MIIAENSRYLIAILNSALIDFYFPKIASGLGDHGTRYFANFVANIPIPKITKEQQRPFVDLVNKILAAREDNLAADISQYESEINRLVYNLYGLTPPKSPS